MRVIWQLRMLRLHVLFSCLSMPLRGLSQIVQPNSMFKLIAPQTNTEFKCVSVGPSGVWAIDLNETVWYRHNTCNAPDGEGELWITAPGGRIKLSQVDVGRKVLWGVDPNDNVYVLRGGSCGVWQAWEKVRERPTMKQVTVSPRGYVWAIRRNGDVYYRLGVSSSNQMGSEWVKIPGLQLSMISAGKSGVWGVTNKPEKVVYRLGTFGDNGSRGLGWMTVPGGEVRSISSGDNKVVAVSENREIFVRQEMYSSHPIGIYWRKLDGELDEADTFEDAVWGINGSKVFSFARINAAPN